jgi:hypothetical protein
MNNLAMMRKTYFKGIFTLILAAGLIGSEAYAQLSMGPRGGVNIGLVSSNQPVDNLINIGFGGGLTFRYQFRGAAVKRLNLHGDALFNIQGTSSKLRTENSGVLVSEAETVNVRNNVQIPIYVGYEIPFGRKSLVPYDIKTSLISYHLYGGAALNYTLGMVSSTKTTTYNSDGSVDQVTQGASATVESTEYKPLDIGLLLGNGFSIRLDQDNRQRLYVDARYIMGFLNQSNVQGVEETWSAMQIQVAYTRVLTKRRYAGRP